MYEATVATEESIRKDALCVKAVAALTTVADEGRLLGGTRLHAYVDVGGPYKGYYTCTSFCASHRVDGTQH